MSIPDNITYEMRKLLLEDLKILSKEEYEEVYRIIKRNNVEYTENGNGIFFDLTLISSEVYSKLCQFMDFCKSQRQSEEARTHEMDTLRLETGKN